MIFSPPTWGTRPPRAWQAAVFPIAARHFAVPEPEPAIIRAIMGAGKSVVIAELCACLQHSEREPIVVTTSSQLLVKQLRTTIAERVAGKQFVGMYFTERKDSTADIVVCCTPSATNLARDLAGLGRRCSLWIADEAHKTECSTILEAHKQLQPAAELGFTATPYRAALKERLSIFSHQLFDYGPQEALRDAVVVPFNIKYWENEGTPLDDACIAMMTAHTTGPGICNASSIEDCERFAVKMQEKGIPAAAVHSGLNSWERESRITALEKGELRCIVHVNMLCEGADYPWLRWMCLRRYVESRVRFLQELGRGLRAFPGKDVLTVLDPNNLFAIHKITYEAALGAEPEEEEVIEAILELPPEQMAAEIAKEAKEAVALQLYEMNLRRMVVACDAAGMCPERVITRKQDRQKPPTKMQLAMIKGVFPMALKHIDSHWLHFFNLVQKYTARFNYAAASDLCCILASIANTCRFPPISEDGRIRASIGETIKEQMPLSAEGNRLRETNPTPQPSASQGQLELEFK